MRLTKSDKEAFVRAVMDDVPQIDYDEQVRSLMNKWGNESLPEELRLPAKKYPDYFAKHYVYTPDGCAGVSIICNPDWIYEGFRRAEPLKNAELVAIGQAARQQQEARNDLRIKVTGLINMCSTLKAAKERLPEFEKYLPADRDGSGLTNLPIANVVTDLMNAGWPKDAVAA